MLQENQLPKMEVVCQLNPRDRWTPYSSRGKVRHRRGELLLRECPFLGPRGACQGRFERASVTPSLLFSPAQHSRAIGVPMSKLAKPPLEDTDLTGLGVDVAPLLQLGGHLIVDRHESRHGSASTKQGTPPPLHSTPGSSKTSRNPP